MSAANAEPAQTPDPADRPAAKKPRSLRRRIFLKVMFVFYCLVLLEIGSRVYWVIKRDVPFFGGRQDFYNVFYEELRDSGVWDADLGPNDGHFDVLLLGGSAMDRVHRSLGDRSNVIQERLEAIVGQPVRTFNLAAPAMTTLDSLKKYRLMGDYDRHFDLVVLYHGINDVRMNNAPAEMFRDDYSHLAFYHKITLLESQMGLTLLFRTPYMIEYTVVNALGSKKLKVYAPRHRLNEYWQSFGGDIKTEGPFRDNLTEILDLAAERDEPVLMLTFAWYIPEGYTEAKCDAGEADFSGEVAPDPVEKWGTVETVPQGMAVHNGIIRDLAAPRAETGGVLLVDFEPMVERTGANFDDVCHLSEQAKMQFLDAVIEGARPVLQRAAGTP